MDNALFILLFEPGEFFAPRSVVTHPTAILQCSAACTNVGDNALFHTSADLLTQRVLTKDADRAVGALPYQFHYFTHQQRALKKQSEASFDEIFSALRLTQRFNQLMPAVAIRFDRHQQRAQLYHFNDSAWHGSIMLKYAETASDATAGASNWMRCIEALTAAYPRLLQYRHLLNDTCWYTRWKHDMELERKYTFNKVPDTWALNSALYRAINLQGKLPGFVPELDMSLQVFDYDNHIFEVLEPSAKGYISFIPQTNQKVAIKQKWFEKNAELRKESISYDVALEPEAFADKARELAGGAVKRLAPFRRKRFDVNFESLATGKIYGVYFDICRSLDAPETYAFSQCEVEYCRSRTMFDYRNVEEEFEQVCAFVKTFLEEKGVPFQHNLYSKLDFARETFAAMQQKGNVS